MAGLEQAVTIADVGGRGHPHASDERGRLVTRLADLDVDVTPSDANFVLFRPRNRDADEVWQNLVDRSVLVRNCASWPRR